MPTRVPSIPGYSAFQTPNMGLCTPQYKLSLVDVKLVSGHPLLAPAAIDAVKGYVYKPFMLNGAAVDVLIL